MVTGQIVNKLEWHNDLVRDLSWHPTQPMLVSGDFNGCLMRWEHCPAGEPAAHSSTMQAWRPLRSAQTALLGSTCNQALCSPCPSARWEAPSLLKEYPELFLCVQMPPGSCQRRSGTAMAGTGTTERLALPNPCAPAVARPHGSSERRPPAARRTCPCCNPCARCSCRAAGCL